MLNFMYKGLTSEPLLVKFIVRHGITHGQMDSIVGRNVLYCCLHYHTNIYNILTLVFQTYNMDRYCVATEDNSIVITLLLELLQCRDGALRSSDNQFYYVRCDDDDDGPFVHVLTRFFIGTLLVNTVSPL
jgi:hypothetical protein